MNAKENMLEAIQFGKPDHVPLGDEGVWHGFQLEGNIRINDPSDIWGIRWEVGLPGTFPFPKGNPLTSLDRLSDYCFPSPSQLILTDQAREGLRKVDRSQKLVSGGLTLLLFERAWSIMGMDNFLTSLITHPKEAHELLHGIASFDRGVFDRYLELGVDAIGFTEDLGTQRALMMSPAMFREFILPEYVYAFENVLTEGKMISFHSCGCVEAIAADLASIGVTVLNPVQARANDLAKIKRETFGRMALKGAIDTAVLASGKPADVRAEVLRIMDILKPRGGYICAPDQAIPGVPQENYDALWQAAREAGTY